MIDKQQVNQMDIDQLQANPLQPRGMITPDSLMDLVDSIREHGILEPLIAAHTPAAINLLPVKGVGGQPNWLD